MRTEKKGKPTKRRKGTGIPRAVFDRLVREITADLNAELLWQPEAIDALKESSETMLEERFMSAANVAKMCKLSTVRPEHMASRA